MGRKVMKVPLPSRHNYHRRDGEFSLLPIPTLLLSGITVYISLQLGNIR